MLLGLNVVDATWFSLGLFFMLALLINTISIHLNAEFQKYHIHIVFQNLIRYGKTAQQKRDDWLNVFNVPKRWFWHFYALSVVWNGLLCVLSLRVILWGLPYPAWLTDTLGFLTGFPPEAVKQVPQVSSVLVQVLLWVHCLRRLLECLFVSVFSDGIINIVQYAYGLVYYILLGLTVLCPGYMTEGKVTHPVHSQLGWLNVSGAVLFIWACVLQHRALVLLARLRTGASGAVETLAHRVPSGGWFELVSCPHYFAELLIYVSLSVMSGGVSLTWWLVVFYVLFNQALAAQLCQEFYRSKFKSYPRHRKALIPFLL